MVVKTLKRQQPRSTRKGYDRALLPADVQATQPKAWETLTKNHGARAGETLPTHLRDQLDRC